MAATKPLTPNEARVLTERYNSLQGLKLAPWGLVCIVLPLITGSLLVGQTYATFLWVGIPILLLAPILHIAASSYYRRRFGQVTPRGEEEQNRCLLRRRSYPPAKASFFTTIPQN